ncbi:HAD family hydrolase [Kibdelosporangium phytohabitans]|uniref:HAD family hydrolase n=1 Tax=Kibdelosporangium phytohabitans TaxID=860235 RepID=UPI0009F87191|nr:HAD hydrolase-like protein [Kibdelosporangium phytohabitans]MBE1463358.1 phosphoglycolate phosphatase-like HAD superfamily hydrolase [Kibdelosporangium phytohabitans]
MRIQERLSEIDHVMVAFDGPIAELPPASLSVDSLRVMVAEGGLPREVARTEDPFAVLDYAATIGPATERAVHDQLTRVEQGVLLAARRTPGVDEGFDTLAAAGVKITVVGRVATAAIRSFLVMHNLEQYVWYLAGRSGPADRALVPPAPDLVNAAIRTSAVPAEASLFVGSTQADLDAARAAGVATVSTVEQPGCWDALAGLVPRSPLRPGTSSSARPGHTA